MSAKSGPCATTDKALCSRSRPKQKRRPFRVAVVLSSNAWRIFVSALKILCHIEDNVSLPRTFQLLYKRRKLFNGGLLFVENQCICR